MALLSRFRSPRLCSDRETDSTGDEEEDDDEDEEEDFWGPPARSSRPSLASSSDEEDCMPEALAPADLSSYDS